MTSYGERYRLYSPAAANRCYYDLMNSSRSALIVSALIVHMP
jgi:hypothetical protein